MLRLPPEVAARNEEVVATVDALVARHGHDEAALLAILQDLREHHHDIDDVAMQVVADRLGTSPVRVQGVATFYAFIGTGRTGTHTIRVCRTLTCAMGGARRIAEVLAATTGTQFGGTSADGAVTVQWANCIGMCDHPPAMLVDHEAVGRVTPDIARQVVARLRADHTDTDTQESVR
ncbi:MAG: NAD(P)H-dependent oxidoreductase subunit E [Actinobacteria bacterium]|nr:NAD(P)H-dependent oxidoreductase subunit E [Actinomycetota bacterium]MCG2801069.1 NAD(P)H-dependent oxidoreductase subunit E [Cellulomonas sp.]